jgi:hypothetical protein
MPPEGMVHALEEIRRLLRPRGILADIRPVQSATRIEVHCGGTVAYSAPVPGQTFDDLRWADDAVAQAIAGGLYVQDGALDFSWRTYASSVAELRDFVARESAFDTGPSTVWTALQEREFAARIEAALQAAGEGAEVVRLTPARIARLVPLRP